MKLDRMLYHMCCYVVLSNVICNCGILLIINFTVEPFSFLVRYVCV